MITIADYFGCWLCHPDVTETVMENAKKLLDACSQLEAMARYDNVDFPINSETNSQVSGDHYGGFRPQDCPIGAPKSAHKQGLAVDIYDPQGEIDSWCLENIGNLEMCGIYIESPTATHGWSHWSTRAPASGRHVFLP